MEHIQQLPHDDWHEQDLLTKREAAERLASEIRLTRDQLALAPADSIERDQLAKRLAAMETVLGEHE